MVNVQPKNAKLADRARRIIERAAAVPYERAGELLLQAGNDVRVAIVMARTGMERSGAEQLLAAAGGRISEALRKSHHG